LVMNSGGSAKHDNRPNGVAKEDQHHQMSGRDGDEDDREKVKLRPRDGGARDSGHEREGNARGGERSRSRASDKEGVLTDEKEKRGSKRRN
jgi:hypothetical protein